MLSQFYNFYFTFHTVAHLELELQVEERDEYLFKDRSAQWFHMEWPLLFCQFPAMQILDVSGHLAKYVAFALGSITEEMVPEVFSSLHLILIEDEPRSFADIIVAARQPSGRPVIVVEDKEEFKKLSRSARKTVRRYENVPMFHSSCALHTCPYIQHF